MIKTILFSVICATALSAGAQILTINLSDSSIAGMVKVRYSSRKGEVRFDAPRLKLDKVSDTVLRASAADNREMDFFPAWIYVGHEEYPVILEKDGKLDVAISKDGDDVALNYSGDNADVARYMNRYETTFDVYRYFFNENDSTPENVRKAKFENEYISLRREFEKLPDSEIKKFVGRLTDDAHLNFLIRFADENQSKELLGKVDINSWVGLYNYLPIWAFNDNMPKADYDGDMAPWGNAYIDKMSKLISDAAVRDALLNNCVTQVLEYGQCDNVDDFWIPFKRYAGEDSKVVKRYESKVIALKNTRPGMKAPDFSFVDRDGRPHRLSDFTGKVLYIDVWASWCGPCRGEIPYIERHFTEYYKDNDRVRFVSISVDEDRDDWIAALEVDKPKWEQYNVSGDEHENLSTAYGINGIPRFMIINADGTIHNADAFRPSDKDFRAKLDAVINH